MGKKSKKGVSRAGGKSHPKAGTGHGHHKPKTVAVTASTPSSSTAPPAKPAAEKKAVKKEVKTPTPTPPPAAGDPDVQRETLVKILSHLATQNVATLASDAGTETPNQDLTPKSVESLDNPDQAKEDTGVEGASGEDAPESKTPDSAPSVDKADVVDDSKETATDLPASVEESAAVTEPVEKPRELPIDSFQEAEEPSQVKEVATTAITATETPQASGEQKASAEIAEEGVKEETPEAPEKKSDEVADQILVEKTEKEIASRSIDEKLTDDLTDLSSADTDAVAVEKPFLDKPVSTEAQKGCQCEGCIIM